MNYQNFKRHHYAVNWQAIKPHGEQTYLGIQVIITRDASWPFGEVVTDPFEVKYACKLHNFNYNDLDSDENGNFFIKVGSGEWNNYLNEPGKPRDIYLKEQLNIHIQEKMEAAIQKEMEKQGINIPVHVVAYPVD